jgi:hypothetical protein
LYHGHEEIINFIVSQFSDKLELHFSFQQQCGSLLGGVKSKWIAVLGSNTALGRNFSKSFSGEGNLLWNNLTAVCVEGSESSQALRRCSFKVISWLNL